jgi:hypothetical protein
MHFYDLNFYDLNFYDLNFYDFALSFCYLNNFEEKFLATRENVSITSQ